MSGGAGRVAVVAARSVLAVAVAAAVAMALAVTVPGPAFAAATEWGRGAATSTYGMGIEFRQPATLPTDTTRVEILLTSPSFEGTLATEVTASTLGRPTTLSFLYDTSSGSAYPNTPFEARWRVTHADGSVDVGPDVGVVYADTTHDWRTMEGSIVRLHWYDGDEAFAKRVLAVGEKGLAKAQRFLGVAENQPVDFFVYATRDDFMGAFGPGSYEWAGAFALPETRTLFAEIPPDQADTELVGLYVPHELTHIVFDTAARNPYHQPPRWLNEGLAVYLTEGFAPNWRASLDDGVAGDRILPLSAIAVVFPTDAAGADIAYAESVSAVSHIVDRYGKDAIVRLIRAYADGVSDDDAFTRGLGVTVGAFESEWLDSIGARPPARQGPVPAPAGSVPSAWLAGSPPPGVPGATSPAAEAATPLATAAPVPGATGGAAPGVGSAGEGTGIPLLLMTLTAVAGVAVASGLFFLWTRRRRPDAQATGGPSFGIPVASDADPDAPAPDADPDAPAQVAMTSGAASFDDPAGSVSASFDHPAGSVSAPDSRTGVVVWPPEASEDAPGDGPAPGGPAGGPRGPVDRGPET